MITRRFVLCASASLIVTTAGAQSIRARGATVPFPRELGLPPLRVPDRLLSEPNLFPVPAEYYVKAYCQSNCQDKNVSRDAVVEQWQQDGSRVIQKVTAHYNGDPNNTGTSAERLFAPIDAPTWLVFSYSRPDLQSAGYVVSPDKSLITFDASFHSREGVIRLAYSQDPKLLGA